MKPLWLSGLVLWSPIYPTLERFIAADALSSPEEEPEVSWVSSRLLRGSSRLTRILLHLAGQAVEKSGKNPHTIATVYASSYGEIETMVRLLETIFRGDGQLSPMRFKNSVHNAASGLGSIGQGNKAFSTAIAGGLRSFEAGMLEAIAWAQSEGGDVVVACADDVVPPPLTVPVPHEAFGIALVLSTERSPDSLGCITEIVPLSEAHPFPSKVFGRTLPSTLPPNPSAHALPLFEMLLQQRGGLVPLAFEVDHPYALMVHPCSSL
ncbi:MAG: beta-ketoacyl synthase chain length factor [Sandaracinaceae bacterium]|nr:beta-ketoacyl synthase chain length factor [Sandaracinaceae bacterium]MDW8245919.1 beta-ketoacyl synthase chain length factor [Sandaracinaceae bacterium]